VAWLAQLNPFAMVAISGLLAVLEKGADSLQTLLQVPASISDIITGIFLFSMLGCEFFINFQMIFRKKEGHRKEATRP
jgi:simple sugar transport system permease protein